MNDNQYLKARQRNTKNMKWNQLKLIKRFNIYHSS